MNDYNEVTFKLTPCNETLTDVLAALLCDIGYESFVPDSSGLVAYVKASDYDVNALNDVISQYPIPEVDITYNNSLVEGRDWNHEWEKNYFQPIVIGHNQCVIHSTFHTNIPQCLYDIVIDPKMAFGTGHHSTTSLIMSHLLEIDMQGKSVLDMGTGTGILAILAAMRGAIRVTGIEIDPMAHANALENIALNHHDDINIILGDASALNTLDKVDIMLANINRNIILNDIESYTKVLKQGSSLFLSGFYVEDVPMLEEKAATLGLEKVSVRENNNWCCLELIMK